MRDKRMAQEQARSTETSTKESVSQSVTWAEFRWVRLEAQYVTELSVAQAAVSVLVNLCEDAVDRFVHLCVYCVSV